MAVNKFKVASGKWATGANWSKGSAPGITEEAEIEEGNEVKVEANAECRALLVKKNAKVAGSSQITIGDATEPKPTGFNGYALVIESGVSWTGTNNVVFKGTT